MIRKTLKDTQVSTFCVELPNPNSHGMPSPTGTGFFVSPDGWFVTAAHVTSKNGRSDGPQREDIYKGWLTQESRFSSIGGMCKHIKLMHVLPEFDLVLLKTEFEDNAKREWLKGRTEFPYIQISTRKLELGEPVYSFGYPLGEAEAEKRENMVVGISKLSPRVTSAIVSSDIEKTQMLMSGNDPQVYVLDKPLNYGNSGGPIIATETGSVHAFCSRFQPMFVRQPQLKDSNGEIPYIMIPSLYGVVSSFRHGKIIELFSKLGIPFSDK